jgi:hypothetical protein
MHPEYRTAKPRETADFIPVMAYSPPGRLSASATSVA